MNTAENERPEERDFVLNKIITNYAIKWREIGLVLGITPPELDVINADNPDSCEERFKVILRNWLRQDLSATWIKLAEAIFSSFNIRGKVLANVIAVCSAVPLKWENRLLIKKGSMLVP